MLIFRNYAAELTDLYLYCELPWRLSALSDGAACPPLTDILHAPSWRHGGPEAPLHTPRLHTPRLHTPRVLHLIFTLKMPLISLTPSRWNISHNFKAGIINFDKVGSEGKFANTTFIC